MSQRCIALPAAPRSVRCVTDRLTIRIGLSRSSWPRHVPVRASNEGMIDSEWQVVKSVVIVAGRLMGMPNNI